MIHGAAAWYQNDNYPKGDLVLLEWMFDMRTDAEITRVSALVDCDGHALGSGTENGGYSSFTQTQGALPILKCYPRVVCFSPNSEIWKNGNTYAFPAFPLDERYGSKWQAQVVWAVTDPLWQPPHEPCSTGSEDDTGSVWTEDSSGGGDTIDHQYGLGPLVEARTGVPGGFPGLPSGITLNFADAVPPAPNPIVEGVADQWMGPWQLHANLCGALAAFDYANWVLGCPGT